MKTGRIDMVLHLGDQIYPDGEDIQHADKIFQEMFDEMNDEKKVKWQFSLVVCKFFSIIEILGRHDLQRQRIMES